MTSGLPIPPEVVRVLDGFSAPVRRRFLEIRELIFETAAKTEGVGPLTETLKWGEPAYLTAATGSGSTIRLGRGKASDTDCAVLFNCQTTLVESFRTLFPDAFVYEKNRAILVGVSGPLPAVPLAICVRMALTYHRRGKELGADDKQVIRGWPAQGRP